MIKQYFFKMQNKQDVETANQSTVSSYCNCYGCSPQEYFIYILYQHIFIYIFLTYFHEGPIKSKYDLYCKLLDYPEFSLGLNCNYCLL